MIVRRVAMARTVVVVVAAAAVVAVRAMAVVVMVAALAVVAGAEAAMGVVPAVVVVAPSAVDVLLAEADARHSAVAVIRSGRRLRATRRLAAETPTATKGAVSEMVTVRAMATVTPSLVTRRDTTRGAGRATPAGMGMTPDVAVMATVVPAVP